jgi:ABC-2 type transport system permease protein
VQQLRQPIGSLFNLFWPLLLYVLLTVFFTDNLITAQIQGIPAGTYLLAVAGMFGAVSVAFFGFALGLAIERAQGWMRLRRASPVSATIYFAGKLTAALVLCLGLVVGLLLSSVFIVGVVLAPVQLLWLALALLLGVLPLAALGLAISYLSAPGSASAIIQGVFYLLTLPMFLMPETVATLPAWGQWFFELLPSYHLTKISLTAVGLYYGPLAPSLLALALVMSVSLALAVWAYRREEG